MKTTPASLALLLACALVCAAALCPAPVRAQAVRTGTTTRIGGRNVTTYDNITPSGTAPVANPHSATPNADSGISPRASAAITSNFKYQPPPPPKPEDDEVDLRDIDKPKNDIVRLPRMIVTAKKPPVFTDRTLYTHNQLKTLAVARYLSKLDTRFLNKWTLPLFGSSNADRAMQIFFDDERQKNMADMQQQISNSQTSGNTDAAKRQQSEYYDMFLRPQNKNAAPPDSLTRQRGQ